MSEKKTPLEMYCDATTPLFTKEVGERMRLARMKLLLDQAELGKKLGLSQQQVSKLEAGGRILDQSFSTTTFRQVFGDSTSFILFGTGEDRFGDIVVVSYWNEKNAKRGNRTDRSRFWEKKHAK